VARVARMAGAMLLLLVVPTLLGIALDYRLKIWPWGLLVTLVIGILAASVFIVRHTFNAYQRIEDTHAATASTFSTAKQSTPPLVKEDERA